MPVIRTSASGPGSSASSSRSGRGRGASSNSRRGRGCGRDSRRQTSYTPYQPPTFDPRSTITFSGPGGYTSSSEWDESKLDSPSVKKILFTASFAVNGSHLLAILSRPNLVISLEALELGDSDTGNGGLVNDRVMQPLLRATPNLRVLRLDACTSLTDDTLYCAFQCCPRLEQVRITGHDKGKGLIRGPALRELKAHPDLCTGLKELVLYDQSHYSFQKDTQALTKARKGLTIKTGETLGDGIADNMIAAMTGGATLETWANGKLVDIDADMGIYGPGGYEMPFFDVY